MRRTGSSLTAQPPPPATHCPPPLQAIAPIPAESQVHDLTVITNLFQFILIKNFNNLTFCFQKSVFFKLF